jgi:hypothetical protein
VKPADLRLAAAVCIVIGAYDVLYVASMLAGGPPIGPSVNALFPDFLVFHGAARGWLEGKAIYDTGAFTTYQNALYAERIGELETFRPFLYPPLWLLLLLPFAVLAVGKAYALFMALTGGFATMVEAPQSWSRWAAVMTCPAAVWVVLAGQNTFLSLALLYGGLRLLETRPALAGVLLGLLAYKPQIWVLVPLALLSAAQWRALLALVATVALFALASLVVLGPELWRSFFEAAREAGSPQMADTMFAHVYTQMTSVAAAARIAGADPSLAAILQLAASAVAAAAVWFAFRRHAASAARTAVLAAATCLVSPYSLNYDLLLVMPAAAALFVQAAARGFRPGERLLYLALWLVPTVGIVANRAGVPVMPLVVLLFGVAAVARLADAPKGELRPVAAAR